MSESDYHATVETGLNRYTPRRSAPLPSSANVPVSSSDFDSSADSRPRGGTLRQGTRQTSARPAPAAASRRAATAPDASARSRPTRKASAPPASRARPRRAATTPVASASSRPRISHTRGPVRVLAAPATLLADISCPGGRVCPADCSWHPRTPPGWGRSRSTTDTMWDGWSRDAIRWFLPGMAMAVSVGEWEAMSPFARKFYTMDEDLVGGRGGCTFLILASIIDWTGEGSRLGLIGTGTATAAGLSLLVCSASGSRSGSDGWMGRLRRSGCRGGVLLWQAVV